jgi:hypothetical protein
VGFVDFSNLFKKLTIFDLQTVGCETSMAENTTKGHIYRLAMPIAIVHHEWVFRCFNFNSSIQNINSNLK